MRVLLWVTILAAGLWSGYWVIGASAIERNAAGWFAEQSALGYKVETSGIVVHGFPNRFDLTVSGLDLADPATGFGWSAPFAQVFAMTWKPWHLIAALPNEQVITTPTEAITVTSKTMRGSLEVHPGLDLGLHEIVVESSDLGLASTSGWRLSADRVVASTLEDPARANAYRIGLSAKGVEVGDEDAAQVVSLPGKLDEIHLDGTLLLSAPLDGKAGETRPDLEGVEIADVRVKWGTLQVLAKGRVDAGAGGLAEGDIAIRVQGWRALPAVLVALGLVKPQLQPTLTRAMELLAADGPDPEVLDIPLRFAAGRISLGPIPLGAAPRLN